MRDSYIKKDGSVNGAQIVVDIETGKLNRSDIEKLVSDNRIQVAFTGKKFVEKPTSELASMNYDEAKNYLNRIACSFPSGYFSPEYLFHLADVAERVKTLRHEAESSRKASLIIAAIVIIAVVCAAIFLIRR